MTISNKLFLMATLAISMNTCAYYDYNCVGLKSEVIKILDFTQMIEQQATAASKKVVKWLKKGIIDESPNRFSSQTVVEIAHIIEKNTTTTETKVASILLIIANKEASALAEAQKQAKNAAKQAQEQAKHAAKQGKKQAKYNQMKCMNMLALGAGVALAILPHALDVQNMANRFMCKNNNALLEQVKEMINKATASKNDSV